MPTTAVAKTDDGIPTAKVKILGETFTVYKTQNFFTLLGVFDDERPANLPKYILDAVIDDDQRRLKNLIASQRTLTAEQLYDILEDIMEAQADGHPSSGSSESRTTSRTRRASTRSAAT